MPKSLKIFLSILALISIVFSLAIIFDWNPWEKIKTGLTSKTTSSIEKSEKTPEEKEAEAAELTLAWLDSQENEEGYKDSYSCLKEENEKMIYASRIFPSVLWGKLKYYEKNKNNEGAVKLEKGLDLAISISTQNNQWNCKLMKDFWESKILSQEQKEKAKLYCKEAGAEGFNNDFSGNFNDVFTKIDQNELKSSILENIDNFIKGLPVSFKEFYFNDVGSSTSDFEKASAYVSNDVVRYLLGKEENKKEEEPLLDVWFRSALANYYLALQSYSVIEKNLNNNSLLGIASLDLYKMTNEQKYFDMALYLFAENEKFEGEQLTHNYDYVYFALFAKDLFETTGKELYQEKITSTKNKIMAEQFTQPICKDSELADSEKGAFKSGAGNFYLIKENSLILGLLSL